MKSKSFEQLQPSISKQNSSPEDNSLSDEQIESKLRILANHLIDRVLEIQNEAIKKGLNINQEKDMLIMEQLIRSRLP